MTDMQLRIARAIEGLNKTAESLAKSAEITARVAAKMQHPAFAGKEISEAKISEDDISTTISLEVPDVEGVTTIYRQTDGFVRIEILIEPPESERLMELIDALPVKQFNLQAVEPE